MHKHHHVWHSALGFIDEVNHTLLDAKLLEHVFATSSPLLSAEVVPY